MNLIFKLNDLLIEVRVLLNHIYAGIVLSCLERLNLICISCQCIFGLLQLNVLIVHQERSFRKILNQIP